jgi:hypothetical protein
VMWMYTPFIYVAQLGLLHAKDMRPQKKGQVTTGGKERGPDRGKLQRGIRKRSRMSDSAVRPPLVFSNITENDGPLRNKTT